MQNKIIGIVPMKGHSERVPNKNIRMINGKPLFFWILDSLFRSSEVKKVFVDTDSAQIGKMCKSLFDVNIISRPKELQGDYVSMNDIIAYDIEYIGDSHYLQTHATNPLLTSRTIDEAVRKYYSLKNYDSLFSVNRVQSRLYDANLNPINHKPGELKRTQDLPAVYEENSNMYIFSQDSFMKNNLNRIGKKPFLFEMDELESVDIDTESDFKLADALLRLSLDKK